VLQLAIPSPVAGADTPAEIPLRTGGTLTHFDRGRDAYARPAPGLSAAELRRFGLGNRVFNTRWVQAPASVSGFDGLGPVFNRDSCSGCHQNDGRGRPPDAQAPELRDSFVIKISSPHRRAQRQIADRFGPQLNTAGIAGVAGEGRIELSYQTSSGRYADGSAFELRKPQMRITEPHLPLPRKAQLGLRVAPAVFGLGLIEAIPAEALLAQADADDTDGDGISGRVNWVVAQGQAKPQIGRFGWKAHAASLADQSVDAAFQDIGLTSADRPAQNCAPAQQLCRSAYADESVELDANLLSALVSYLQTLGVPARRADLDAGRDAEGLRLFARLGCADCHRPLWRSGQSHPLALLREQTFYPFSDFLLHDMGDGLAGGGSDGTADSREWRTPPLWGLGLLERVNGHTLLLHDGRARSVAEAVLWHDGEGREAREAFRNASLAERRLLTDFVLGL
jgi:CxxC motif-containing protein (DUF1111 family)